jgi:transposase InsO family protein
MFPILLRLESGRRLSYTEKKNPVVRLLDNQKKQLVLRDRILYRKRLVNGQTNYQLVLPQHLRLRALQGVHDDNGHMGYDRSLQLLRDRYYWPHVSQDMRNHIKNCHRCLRRKSPPDKASLVNISTTQPLELLCVDFLGLEPSKGGIENVLVITDHFTKYAQAIPCRKQDAQTTAKALWNTFICHYGFPQRLHSDQGANFEGRIIKHLCKLAGIKKSRSTPYHPEGNGMCERFNRTLINMLGTLSPSEKSNWKDHIGPIVHAYNSTKHDTTGHSPFFLMYGRHPRLSVDVLFGLDSTSPDEPNYTKFVESLKSRLHQAYTIAIRNIQKSQNSQKSNYDRKTRGSVLQLGDRVLVRNVKIRGKRKLADNWEEDAYDVLEQPNKDIPVYKVKKENGTGSTRVLHRNLLLPINTLPLDIQIPPESSCGKSDHSDDVVSSQSESESDEEYFPVRQQELGQPAVEHQADDLPSSDPIDEAVQNEPDIQGEMNNISPIRQERDATVVEPADQTDGTPDVIDLPPQVDDNDDLNSSTNSVAYHVSETEIDPGPRRSTRNRIPTRFYRDDDWVTDFHTYCGPVYHI